MPKTYTVITQLLPNRYENVSGIARGGLPTSILGMPSYRLRKEGSKNPPNRMVLYSSGLQVCGDRYKLAIAILPLNYSSAYRKGCISGKVEDGVNSNNIIVATAVMVHVLQGQANIKVIAGRPLINLP